MKMREYSSSKPRKTRAGREDDARRDGLAGISGGLDDVVFKNGGAAEDAEDGDGEDSDGNGGGDGEAGAEADVDRDGSEDDPEDAAQNDGARGEFGRLLIRGNKRFERGLLDFDFGHGVSPVAASLRIRVIT